MSKIMVVTAKMKDFRLRGGGAHSNEDGNIDEITIVNAHLNHATSMGRLRSGYNKFWDELAKYCAVFRPRFLCGEFGAALFNVAPQMRVRGFQINLAAWQCWRRCEDEGVMVGDTGIFRLGPCDAIQLCYHSNVFGFSAPAGSFDLTYFGDEENESDSEPLQRPYPEVEPFPHQFNARHFKTCVNAHPRRRELFMKNTFTPVFGEETPAMAEMQAFSNNKEMFPHGVSTSMGGFSWFLPQDVASEQKVGCFDTSSYALGSCVPVMIFMGKEEPEKRGQKRRHNGVYM